MFLTPTLDEIRQAILRDVVSLNPTADVAVDSDNYARASSIAAVAEGIYTHQKWIIKQFFPDTADTEFLEKHATLRGISRRKATYASGQGLKVFGDTGSVIDVGKQVVTADGRFYEVIEQGQIADKSVLLKVRSLNSGVSQNIIQPIKASFMSAPVGVQTECELREIVGGTNDETDTSLLERLLNRIRRPAAGGNKYDYKAWALDVDGVESAFVYPLRRGLGTVDIVITSNHDLPSDETVQRVQAYIDEMRPVTAKGVSVVKPTARRVDFVINVKLSSVALDEITQEITIALGEYFNQLQPTEELVLSKCEATISNLIGVVDSKIVTPRTNLKADTHEHLEWFRLGKVQVEVMS
ncbi:baseplate J/gp47 family protein [Histophilus somni]|uniref:Baseplate J/gp47 family protein n=1 Tax=Histophilus somni TaxID=731 RepID=A0A9Q6Z031_HISSO|nr:baseplate J/gp47 family protein [Histophilus somni]ARU65492.1 baseplate J protein [Histophilus somni]ARU67359.1 baseplate J protein [Histophilus somni]ARU69240.1 baseplate J protein [Histophilus somni]ARU71117.1 baseplate J protein [Histophilus somni]ARU72988.1 baseplate J protein [Histophilus somni]